jgi:2-polyprenyl-6-methoxyphenol hydroxylase-like FAD-dependent oxidoreductase
MSPLRLNVDRDCPISSILAACDGINSVIRRQFYPQDKVNFAGINTWRGVTQHKPILDGRTYMRVGSILTGKMAIYPSSITSTATATATS